MQASRNWPKTLPNASYKGFGFFIEEESLPKSGREVATHQYVKTEAHDTEDMGRKPREIRVDAYLASDTADTDAQAFIELCSQAGAGTLQLAFLGSYQARCTNCHATGKKDEQGRLKFVLDFCEASSNGTTGVTATPLGNRLAASALNGIPAALSARLAAIDVTVMATGAIAHDYEAPSRVFISF